MAGRFGALGKSKVSRGGVYFKEGNFEVEIVKVLMKESRRGDDLFIIEAKVLESSNDAMPADTVASQIISMKYDAAMSNIKGFLGAALGIEEPDTYDPEDQDVDEFWEEAAEAAIDDDNPLAGTVLGLQVVEITTRTGNPFSKHTWACRD